METLKKHQNLIFAALVGATTTLIATKLVKKYHTFCCEKTACQAKASPFGKDVINVCLTGAAGQIGYSLIPMICTGQVFGNLKINLRLLDIPPMEKVLKGVALEIEDGAYKNIVSVQIGSNPKELFKDLDFGIFCGGFPRKPGMERKELLSTNGKIFKEQGAALNEVASSHCKCVVVANPANTNCLILLKNAPRIPKENFSALTRLDHNRCLSQLSNKTKIPVEKVKNVIIWGNHSSTQYPDVNHGTIEGRPIREVVKDDKYLNEDLIVRVQKRGAEVLEQRGSSSVFSAGNAVKDHIHSWIFGTQHHEWTSMGVYSSGQYGAPEDVVYSFPVHCHNGNWGIHDSLSIDEFSRTKMKITGDELLAEKADAL